MPQAAAIITAVAAVAGVASQTGLGIAAGARQRKAMEDAKQAADQQRRDQMKAIEDERRAQAASEQKRQEVASAAAEQQSIYARTNRPKGGTLLTSPLGASIAPQASSKTLLGS